MRSRINTWKITLASAIIACTSLAGIPVGLLRTLNSDPPQPHLGYTSLLKQLSPNEWILDCAIQKQQCQVTFCLYNNFNFIVSVQHLHPDLLPRGKVRPVEASLLAIHSTKRCLMRCWIPDMKLHQLTRLVGSLGQIQTPGTNLGGLG